MRCAAEIATAAARHRFRDGLQRREISSDSQTIAAPVKRRKSDVHCDNGRCVRDRRRLRWCGSGAPASIRQELTEVALTQNSFEAPVMDAAISPNGNLLAYADASGLNLKVIVRDEVHSLYTPAAARIGTNRLVS